MNSLGEIIGYAHWLVMRGQNAGNLRFDGHIVAEEEMSISRKCRSLADILVKKLTTCREEEIAQLLDCYDIIFRLGYQRVPDEQFIAGQRQRLITAWRRGNRNIAESGVFDTLSNAMHSLNSPKLIGEYVGLRSRIIDKWAQHA